MTATVVGVNLPTFVERGGRHARAPRDVAAVVGVNLPTFVERPTLSSPSAPTATVVGVNLPTFVERLSSTQIAAMTDNCRRG